MADTAKAPAPSGPQCSRRPRVALAVIVTCQLLGVPDSTVPPSPNETGRSHGADRVPRYDVQLDADRGMCHSAPTLRFVNK